MQIHAVCPSCQNKYQLARGLLGQKIRCPNPDCRQFFEVQEAPVERVKSPPKPARDRRAPSFDDDPTGPVSGEPPVNDWSALPPPPVRRREPGMPSPEPTPAPAVKAAHSDEVLAWMMSAPPQAEAPAAPFEPEEVVMVGDSEAAADDYDPYSHHAPKKTRFVQWAIIGMIVVILFGGGGALWYMKNRSAKQERLMADEAQKALNSKSYGVATRSYDDLSKRFEKSKNVQTYRFLKGFAEACDAASNGDAPEARRVKLSDYVSKADADDRSKAALDERRDEIYGLFLNIAMDQASDAEKKVADAAAKHWPAVETKEAKDSVRDLTKSEGMLRQHATKAVKEPVPEKLSERMAKLAATVSAGDRYVDFIKRVDELLKKETLTAANVSAAEDLANKQNYTQEQEFVRRLSEAKTTMRERIQFVEAPRRADPAPVADSLVSLLVGGSTGTPTANERAVFAVARGVLFALAERDGRLLWATRVGIDTNTLPVRIPKQGRFGEAVLVPTADGKGLVARETLTGKSRWYQQFTAPMRGKPLLVERRVFVPLADEKGTVVALDGNSGEQEGYIELGTRLGPGGATLGTSLIFMPADSQSIFLLNANPPANVGGGKLALQTILLSGHGAGTLRCEPVVTINGDEETGTGSVILCQSDGLGAMKVRAFSFTNPITKLGEAVEEKLPGWSWFAPLCDQENVALVTDTGAFALLGVSRGDGGDKALFPLEVRIPPPGGVLARGQVAHMEEGAFWSLENGELIMRRRGLHLKEGLKFAPGWRESDAPTAKPLSLKLGSPLHAAQISAERDVLFVVTQTVSPPAWFATAVETQTGKIKWQQPLGLAPQGDPIRLGAFVYQLDQGGGLYQIDPKQITLPSGSQWALGGNLILKPRADVVGSPAMVPAADGKSAYVVFTTGDGKQLQIREVVPGSPVKEIPAPKLPATFAGTPLLLGQTLIVPLSNGSLYRLVIGSGKDGEIGPDWRSPTQSESARGFLVSLGGDELLATDGSRGLVAYKWPAGQSFSLKYQIAAQDRIVAPPLVIPVKEKDTPPRVIIADAGGRVTLYEGEPLAKTSSWDMRSKKFGNEITAGPFFLDAADGAPQRILVVVDQTLLLCLELDVQTPKWRYQARDEKRPASERGDGIAFRPTASGNALILADLSGRFVAIDSELGTLRGDFFPKDQALPAAPVAAPVEFGADTMFAPLSDGTVLLIPLDKLIPKTP